MVCFPLILCLYAPLEYLRWKGCHSSGCTTPPAPFCQIQHSNAEFLPRLQCSQRRVALPDAHGAADLLGDDHPAQVVLMCQVKHKKSVVHFFVIRFLYFTTFYLLFHRKNTEKILRSKKVQLAPNRYSTLKQRKRGTPMC